MSTAVREGTLDEREIIEFYEKGYVRPGRILSDAEVTDLRETVERVRHLDAANGRAADLLDPDLWPDVDDGEKPASDRRERVEFLFNVWLVDDGFRHAVFNPRLAEWAAQLIGTNSVRLLEDNALIKEPEVGGELRWHQDFSYWPLAQPNAVTAWIALDPTTEASGAMRIAVGSHHLGERLPVVFGTGTPYMRDARPGTVGLISDPRELGLATEVVELEPGEVSFHSSLVWHGSSPNVSAGARRAIVIRYVGDGTIWLGSRRYEYNYTDAEVGIAVGSPIGGRYFPRIPF